MRPGVLALLLVGAVSARAQVPLPEPGAAANDALHLLEFTAGGGVVSLDVDAAAAGSEPDDAVDTSTEIHWVNGIGQTAKLTVSTACPGQRFGLSVGATVTSWGSGTAATVSPPVALVDGMAATDLLRDIPTAAPGREGTATLTYRASATVADGTSADHGDDVHTVTYTFLAQ